MLLVRSIDVFASVYLLHSTGVLRSVVFCCFGLQFGLLFVGCGVCTCFVFYCFIVVFC